MKKFGETEGLRDDGIERPAMSDVVWALEFALQLQETVERKGQIVGNGFFGPGGGFGVQNFGNGYGAGYEGPSGGYAKGGTIRPTVVCKEKGLC